MSLFAIWALVWLSGPRGGICGEVLAGHPRLSNPLVEIPAGPAWVGASDGQADEAPRRRVLVPRFAIQRHEVTVAEYCRCVRSGACTAPRRMAAQPTLPVTWVTFHQAQRYCRFLGLRLPKEVEWEKAAAGPKGLRYPWGERAECWRANFGSYESQGPCGGVNPGHPEPVGSRPQGASFYGVLDMAGNVWEWTVGAHKGPVLRGGSCCSIFLLPRTAQRLKIKGSYADADIGFRCVASRPTTAKRLLGGMSWAKETAETL